MKKTLTLIFVLVSLSVFGQKTYTVRNAIQVVPIQIKALTKDSVFQVSWSVFGINRNDTTSGANSYVQLYDRKAKRIQEINVHIPYSVLSVWLEDKIIDDYILTFLGLKKR